MTTKLGYAWDGGFEHKHNEDCDCLKECGACDETFEVEDLGDVVETHDEDGERWDTPIEHTGFCAECRALVEAGNAKGAARGVAS